MLENPMVDDKWWGKEPKRIVVDVCSICSAVIYSDEAYYDLGNNIYCEPCVEDARKVADE